MKRQFLLHIPQNMQGVRPGRNVHESHRFRRITYKFMFQYAPEHVKKSAKN